VSYLDDFAARTWELIATGFVLLVVVGIFAGAGAPADPEEEFDDTAAWDRGHDEWIDREAGVL
jgi:hypothetical protein